ncbi:hypothetical protein L207DRAFT_635865 [Hyaloscypha variabilis F]|uniref:Transcription factor domain-containing protein n=1 Tax=Hyaloscypha variabilis (strain UAMH 11265 / GT02V1 / F) TaxID=1149755 RepID=A0A2J6RJ51_HYAVF|nr:hypothetical protein L207DRAFT_635865 [Hyaloscypha variabilis F]
MHHPVWVIVLAYQCLDWMLHLIMLTCKLQVAISTRTQFGKNTLETQPMTCILFLHVTAFYHNLSSNTWPSLQLDSETSHVDGTISADGRSDLISPSFLWNFPSDTLFGAHFNHFKDRVVLGSFHVISLSPLFVHLDTKTIIEKRSSKSSLHGSALGRVYCMSILKSFPGMLCANNGALPPFIHPQSRASVCVQTNLEDTEKLPEPLSICSSIMRMYVARSPGNLAFIWRTIQAESARIEEEYRFCNTRNTLASIQAMTIYLILGLLDDSEHSPDGNILMPMLNTTKSMADTLRPSGWLCTEDIPHELPAWEEWVQAESLRRTAVILVLIIHIFNIEHAPGLPQCGGLAQVPLPCSKTLWQASDRALWEVEYRRQYLEGRRRWRRDPTYGDLLTGGRDEREEELQRADLSEWFVDMDEMGTLVTMAVSML